MAMITRCPQCGTAFQVVPDQLRVRNGLVRCGACSTVFDGRACLVAKLPPVSASASAPVPAPAPLPSPVCSRPEPVLPPAVLRGRADMRPGAPAESGSLPPEDESDWDEAVAAAEPSRGEAGSPPWEAVPEDEAPIVPGGDPYVDAPPHVLRTRNADAPLAQAPQPPVDDDALGRVVQGEARTRYFGATDVGRTPPEFLDEDRLRARRIIRQLWGYLCMGGLAVLVLQLVFVYRSAIATAVPDLRPMLESVCQPLDCKVGYARRIERIFITSSSLHPPPGQSAAPPQDRTPLVLDVVLRNRYDRPQHWPALLLDLTDISDTVVARKVVPPQAYVPPALAGGPFLPGAEISVSVPIEVDGLSVNGYQLDKFFP